MNTVDTLIKYSTSLLRASSVRIARMATLVVFGVVFAFAGEIFAQVSGTVKDADGTLRGVTIRVKGSTKGAVSDKDGKYSIATTDADKVLVFSLVGYSKKEIEISGRSTIDMVMSLDLQKLEDVIVVGYGSQSKRDLTGNVVKIKASEIADMPVPTIDQALQGKAAGVLVTANSGKLGGGVQVRVRGQSSVTASNEPLYVVDGIPISTGFGIFNSEGGTINTNPLVDINPQDIESIDILKDASSAAIYGSRGANGVVLVTTKKGKIGTTRVNLSVQRGISQPGKSLEFLNTEQYVSLYRRAAAASDRIDGLPASDPDSYTTYIEDFFKTQSLNTFPSKAPNTNWSNAVMRNDAPITQIDFNVNGGNEKTTFYGSGQYLEQEGILIGNKLSRFTGRLNVEQKVSDIFKTGFNVTVSRSLNQRLSGDRQFDNPLQAVALPPLSPLTDPTTGLPIGTPPGDPSIPYYYNPIVNVGNVKRDLVVFRNVGNVFAELQLPFLQGLAIRTAFGFDLANQQEDRYFNSRTARNYTLATSGYGEVLSGRTDNFNINAYFTYNRSFESFNVDAVAGTEYQRSQRIDAFAAAKDFPSDAFRTLTTAASKTDARSNQQDFAFLSYFARGNFKINDKYLVSVNARIDGSSRFGANNRYGFFPAASVGWILSEEDFLKDNSAISYLKVRAGFGRTGNAEGIGNYSSLALVSGDAAYGARPGQRPSQLSNPNLTWETTDQFDGGIDFGFIGNKITGELAVYSKSTSGLLLDVNVPATTGFLRQTRNIGSLNNQGIEFAINTENVATEDFTWRTNFNIAINRNQITNLGGQIIEAGLNSMSRAVEGQPIGTFFTAEYAGVNPNNGDALWFKDSARADGSVARVTTRTYSQANRVVVGNALPLFVGGITNTISFKGFDLSFLFSGQIGNKINFYGVGRFSSANARFEDNQTVDQIGAWTAENKSTTIPEARLFFNNGAQPSSRFIYDGSFVRLRNVTLAYNFPKSLLESISLNSLRLFVTGQNLLLFTSYRGWDPEVNADDIVGNIAQGYDFYTAPQPRTITVGINIGF